MAADRSESAAGGRAPSLALPTPGASTQLANLAERVVRYGLPAIIATLPLEFTAQIIRLQLVRYVLLVVGLAFAYLVLTRRRTLAVPLGASLVLVAAYAAASVLSWLFTRAPGSGNSLLDVTAYPVVALLIVNLVRDEADLRRGWNTLLASGLAFSVLGAFLYFSHVSIWRADPDGFFRVNATFGDPNIAARFLILVACAGVLMYAARQRPSWLAVASVASAAAVVPLTFSKSGYLVFVIAVLLAVPLATSWRRAASIAAGALVVFTAVMLINPPTRVRAAVSVGVVLGIEPYGGSNPLESKDSLGAGRVDPVRSYLIEAAWAMFRDHPVTGVGLGGYQNAIKTTYKGFLPTMNPIYLNHTSALTILAEQGVVGGLLFAGFLVFLTWEVVAPLRRRGRWRNWIVMPAVLIIPIVVLAEFEGRLVEEPYLWLALGLMFAARRLEGSVRSVELP